MNWNEECRKFLSEQAGRERAELRRLVDILRNTRIRIALHAFSHEMEFVLRDAWIEGPAVGQKLQVRIRGEGVVLLDEEIPCLLPLPENRQECSSCLAYRPTGDMKRSESKTPFGTNVVWTCGDAFKEQCRDGSAKRLAWATIPGRGGYR